MKVEISTTITEWQVKEIEFPIYCYEQREDESGLDYSVYTKIEKDSFYQIVSKLTGTTFHHWKTNNQRLSSHWLENTCDKKEWDEVVEHTIKQIKQFEI